MIDQITVLSIEQVLRAYTSLPYIKSVPTKIKQVTEEDIAYEPFFYDLEGRRHDLTTERCICIGPDGERWTTSQQSLERDRYPISEEDAEGYRLYLMRNPKAIQCFDISFPFALISKGETWTCENANGGMITWNGKQGEDGDMRVIARTIFEQTYEITR